MRLVVVTVLAAFLLVSVPSGADPQVAYYAEAEDCTLRDLFLTADCTTVSHQGTIVFDSCGANEDSQCVFHVTQSATGRASLPEFRTELVSCIEAPRLLFIDNCLSNVHRWGCSAGSWTSLYHTCSWGEPVDLWIPRETCATHRLTSEVRDLAPGLLIVGWRNQVVTELTACRDADDNMALTVIDGPTRYLPIRLP